MPISGVYEPRHPSLKSSLQLHALLASLSELYAKLLRLATREHSTGYQSEFPRDALAHLDMYSHLQGVNERRKLASLLVLTPATGCMQLHGSAPQIKQAGHKAALDQRSTLGPWGHGWQS